MKRYLVALPVLFVLYIIFLSVMPTFLSLNQRLESKTLIIESWISPYETELALPLIGSDSIERIFIIGALYPEDREHFLSVCEDYFKKQSDKNADINSGVWMLTNSALCFNGDNFRSIPGGDSIKITVRARSSSDFKYHAHFNLILNGQCMGSAFADKTGQEYSFKIRTPDAGLKSLCVFFDNDVFTGAGDRNLFIYSIRLDKTDYPARVNNTLLSKEYGRYCNGFISQAEELKNYLTELGADPSKMVVIEYDPSKNNRTLSSAIAFKDYFKSRIFTSANILSSGFHSRRSWITYKKVLGNNPSIGVVNYGHTGFMKGKRNNLFASFINLNNEAFSYFINWITLNF